MKYEDFIKALEADANLRQKFQAKLKAANPTDEQAVWKASSDAARELGFDVDAGEFALAQRSAQILSDDELEQVSGGGRPSCTWDYVCRLAWNCCIDTNQCDGMEYCSNRITCSSDSYINTTCLTDYQVDGVQRYCSGQENRDFIDN